MSYPETPMTRREMYLDAIARGETDGLPAVPNTRQEVYLDAIARNGGGAGSKIVAENYIETKPYAVGEHAVNGGKLYVKTSGAEAAEVWTPAHWTEITVGEELTRLSSSIGQVLQKLPVISGDEPVGMQEGLFVDTNDPNPDYNIFDRVDELTSSIAESLPEDYTPTEGELKTVNGRLCIYTDGEWVQTNMSDRLGGAITVVDGKLCVRVESEA